MSGGFLTHRCRQPFLTPMSTALRTSGQHDLPELPKPQTPALRSASGSESPQATRLLHASCSDFEFSFQHPRIALSGFSASVFVFAEQCLCPCASGKGSPPGGLGQPSPLLLCPCASGKGSPLGGLGQPSPLLLCLCALGKGSPGWARLAQSSLAVPVGLGEGESPGWVQPAQTPLAVPVRPSCLFHRPRERWHAHCGRRAWEANSPALIPLPPGRKPLP